MTLSVAAPFFPSLRLLAAVALTVSASLTMPATVLADCWIMCIQQHSPAAEPYV